MTVHFDAPPCHTNISIRWPSIAVPAGHRRILTSSHRTTIAPIAELRRKSPHRSNQKAPEVREGKFSNLSFNTWQNLYVAETELKDIALSEDLNVSIMTAPLQSAVAEKATDGNCYFAVDALLEPPTATAKEAPSIVLWDASASREKTDHDAELAFLEKILPQNRQLTLLGFRDRPMQPATFNSPGGF